MADAFIKEHSIAVTIDFKPRCENCNRQLAIKLTRPWVIKCNRCKHPNSK